MQPRPDLPDLASFACGPGSPAGGLDPSQRAAAELLRSGRSVFLSGPGGSGKSYVIRTVFGGRSDVALTASTGVAASLLGGRTLHSFLGIGLGRTREDVFRGVRRRAAALRRFRVIVVDEASMLGGDLFAWICDAMDCHAPTGRPGPWGGRQVVLSGDPYQLGPVSGGYYFNLPAFREAFEFVELAGAHRQTDADFRAILGRIRTGDADAVDELLELAAAQDDDDDDLVPRTVILSTNRAVEETNAREFAALETPLVVLRARDAGAKALLNEALAPERLPLRVGAQVMVTRNVSLEDGVCNGTRGVVTEISDEVVRVHLAGGRVYSLTRFPFEVREDLAPGPPAAVRRQFPLRLAWAVTVHKAQGCTLDRAALDLSGTFAPGQIYTALSRVRDLRGLRVLGRPAGGSWRQRMVAPEVRSLVVG